MRRKKPRVVWLPSDTNTQLRSSSVATAGEFTGLHNFQINASSDAATSAEDAVVLDRDPQGGVGSAFSSLADLESSGYRLRRVVGKIFVFCEQAAIGAASTWAVTAGLIIRRVNAQGISLAALDPVLNDTSPQMRTAWGDPWIWRRTWILQNAQSTRMGTLPFLAGDNMVMSSALDGPHVDAKTARLVGPEERLILDISIVSAFQDNPVGAPGTNFRVVTDLRALGSMRSSAGNRRNASR